MLEQVIVHEIVVTLRIVPRQPHIFIQIERGHLRKIEAFFTVHPDELLVEADGSASRRQPQHRIGF